MTTRLYPPIHFFDPQLLEWSSNQIRARSKERLDAIMQQFNTMSSLYGSDWPQRFPSSFRELAGSMESWRPQGFFGPDPTYNTPFRFPREPAGQPATGAVSDIGGGASVGSETAPGSGGGAGSGSWTPIDDAGTMPSDAPPGAVPGASTGVTGAVIPGTAGERIAIPGSRQGAAFVTVYPETRGSVLENVPMPTDPNTGRVDINAANAMIERAIHAGQIRRPSTPHEQSAERRAAIEKMRDQLEVAVAAGNQDQAKAIVAKIREFDPDLTEEFLMTKALEPRQTRARQEWDRHQKNDYLRLQRSWEDVERAARSRSWRELPALVAKHNALVRAVQAGLKRHADDAKSKFNVDVGFDASDLQEITPEQMRQMQAGGEAQVDRQAQLDQERADRAARAGTRAGTKRGRGDAVDRAREARETERTRRKLEGMEDVLSKARAAVDKAYAKWRDYSFPSDKAKWEAAAKRYSVLEGRYRARYGRVPGAATPGLPQGTRPQGPAQPQGTQQPDVLSDAEAGIPASQYPGRTLNNGAYRSDGRRWVRVRVR